MANKDLPLAATIVGGVVTVTVGVSTLCKAVKDVPVFEEEPEVTDEYAFARAVVAQLTVPNADGVMPICHALDAAVAAAVVAGADGIRTASSG